MLSGLGRRHSSIGRALTFTGGAMLLARAATGHSRVYEAIGISTAPLIEGGGLNIEGAVTIDRPRGELYRFWSDPTNLPMVMRHVESVTARDGVTHWVVRGPRNMKLEWDAAIMNEEPNERIAWHSVEGSPVEQAGSVQFFDAGDAGTEVRVKLRYKPPAGFAGFLAARVLNPITEAEVEEDLRRFKHAMETNTGIAAEPRTGTTAWAETTRTATEPAAAVTPAGTDEKRSITPTYVEHLP